MNQFDKAIGKIDELKTLVETMGKEKRANFEAIPAGSCRHFGSYGRTQHSAQGRSGRSQQGPRQSAPTAKLEECVKDCNDPNDDECAEREP